MNDIALYVFLGAVAFLLAAGAAVGCVVLIGCVYRVADVLWGVGDRGRRFLEVRREVREANRILARCRELDLDVDQVLTLEAAGSESESRVD